METMANPQGSLNAAVRSDLRFNLGGQNQVCSVYGATTFGDLGNIEVFRFDYGTDQVPQLSADNGTTIFKPNVLDVSEAGRWMYFYTISMSLTPSFSAPSSPVSIVSGVPFQPNANASSVTVVNSILAAGIVGLNASILIESCPTQNGTYVTVSNDNLFIQVLNVANTRGSSAIPAAKGHWLKVTYSGSPVSGTRTRWDLIG